MDFTRTTLETSGVALALLLAPACVLDNKVGGTPLTDGTDDDPSSGSDGAATDTTSVTEGSSDPDDPSASVGPSGTGEPPNPTGADDTTAGPVEEQPCLEVETVLALDEAGPGGFSAEEVLAGKLGPRETTLQFADEPLSLSEQWKSKSLPLTVELRYEGGQIRWIDSEVNPDYEDMDEGGLFEDCEDRLLVDVEYDFVTERGEFAEHRAATLEAFGVASASLQIELTPDVMGSFDHTTLYSDPEWVSTAVHVGAFWEGMLAGGELLNEAEFLGGIGFGTIAAWGDPL